MGFKQVNVSIFIMLVLLLSSVVLAQNDDNKPPRIKVEKKIRVEAVSARGARVFYDVVVKDNKDKSPKLKCVPKSGRWFPVGKTRIKCKAKDNQGNRSKKSFTIIVKDFVDGPSPDEIQEESEQEVVVTAEPNTKTITISWAAPTTRADNSPLPFSELGGYEIFIVAEESGDDEVIDIDDPSITEYIYEPDSAGTYHFSISAYDKVGANSDLSDTVSIVVN